MRLASDWRALTTTYAEYTELGAILRAIPHEWVRTVEWSVARTMRRGVVVERPVRYRLACLFDGLVNLQEAKYLGDIFENALRHAFVEHTASHNVPWAALESAVPERAVLAKRLRTSSPLVREAVLEMTFYQLTETIARQWVRIGTPKNPAPGFRALFWNSVHCRDQNLFRSDTAVLRTTRNSVAHSKRLVTTSALRHTLRVCERWLAPLCVDVSGTVDLYRQKRPQFLAGLSELDLRARRGRAPGESR